MPVASVRVNMIGTVEYVGPDLDGAVLEHVINWLSITCPSILANEKASRIFGVETLGQADLNSPVVLYWNHLLAESHPNLRNELPSLYTRQNFILVRDVQEYRGNGPIRYLMSSCSAARPGNVICAPVDPSGQFYVLESKIVVGSASLLLDLHPIFHAIREVRDVLSRQVSEYC